MAGREILPSRLHAEDHGSLSTHRGQQEAAWPTACAPTPADKQVNRGSGSGFSLYLF